LVSFPLLRTALIDSLFSTAMRIVHMAGAVRATTTRAKNQSEPRGGKPLAERNEASVLERA
jgi:hypothetical protein